MQSIPVKVSNGIPKRIPFVEEIDEFGEFGIPKSMVSSDLEFNLFSMFLSLFGDFIFKGDELLDQNA